MKSFIFLVLLTVSGCCGFLHAGERKAPASFETLEDLRAWAEERKGFGDPDGADFHKSSIRLYVTYNSPFSGRAGVFSYAYYLSKAEKKWKLIDSNFFEKNGVLSYVYIDNNSNDLVYVDFDGSVIKRLPLKDYSYK